MTVDKNFVFEEVKELLLKNHSADLITWDTNLETDEGLSLDMSSLEIVEFIVSLENKFDIVIDIEDRYFTVGDVIDGVVSYLEKKDEDELGKTE